MVELISNKEEVYELLKKHFESYSLNDPFEKIAVYNDNGVKGVISYSIIYERAEVNYIVVLKEYRGNNIGNKLLNYALADMKKSCFTVSLEVASDNAAAINLYLKNGFTVEATRPKYYKDKDGYLMVKDLR